VLVTYRFADERLDYSDLAPGRVFSGLPGHPAFPVRLADEIFQRCLALFRARGGTLPLTLYDPCCGCAYLLSVVASLHGDTLERIVGSDADPSVLPVASSNLSYVTSPGIDPRIAKLEELYALHGKASHAEALVSAKRLRDELASRGHDRPIAVDVFVADATSADAPRAMLGEESVDVVIVDVPYGRLSDWIQGTRRRDVPAGHAAKPQFLSSTEKRTLSSARSDPIGGRNHDPLAVQHSPSDGSGRSDTDPIWHLLEALRPILRPHGVAAVVSDKRQRPFHQGYRRLEKFKLGKRQVVFLAPLHSAAAGPASMPFEQERAGVEGDADAE